MSASYEKPGGYHHGNLRRALIAAGVELLRRDGLEALSLRRLAREAGVSHNAPYMHFEDKEALLAAISAEGFQRLASRLADEMAQAGSGWQDRFMQGCECYVRFVLEHPGHAQVMFRHYDGRKHPQAAQAAVNALDLLEGLIREGQSHGHLRTGDSRQQATAVWSMLHGIATLLAGGKMPAEVVGSLSAAELTRRFVGQLVQGLQPR